MVAAMVVGVPAGVRGPVETLWDYHDVHHKLRRCDVGIGLGSHDLGVAIVASELFGRGLFPWLVFTGANAPTTVKEFPRGEAVHYQEYALAHGVPAERVLVEPRATNTQQNLIFTKELLVKHDVPAGSVLLMSRPYQQRRAFATCRKVWPEVDVVCWSRPLSLDDYVASIGDAKRVIDMIVGDTQRIVEYARQGFAIEQEMPDEVLAAFDTLVEAGYTSRLITTAS